MKFDDIEKANILLKQFSSVFTKEPIGEIPRLDSRTNATLPVLFITTKMVLDALKGINTKKSCGPDGLHPLVLAELAEEIAAPVALLFNISLKQGVLPLDWKQAFVTQN